MAAGFMRELGQGRVEVLSAGSAPKDSINPVAVEAMAEVGIDIANNTPKVLTPEAVQHLMQSSQWVAEMCAPSTQVSVMKIGF